MTNQEKQFLEVSEITLDETPVFHHCIELRRKDGSLVDKMNVSVKESEETFKQIHKMWYDIKLKHYKEKQNENT